MPPSSLTALQRTDRSGRVRWVVFDQPGGCIEALSAADVIPALQEILTARDQGWHAVGWIGYEASPGFDPHLETHPAPDGEPLLRFTLFREMREGLPPCGNQPFSVGAPRAGWPEEAFSHRVARIHEAIARGETYQVNLTYPWTVPFTGDPRGWFRRLRTAQAGRHQAYLEEEDRVLISASPERFFLLRDGDIWCKPMKGTALPGQEEPLRSSLKDRAENVMIVDMIRNDLGKVATAGTVQTEQLFEIEPYPSVVQMTSSVTATGPTDPLPWLTALFPCASITGAPKRKTMELICELETSPRGVYTGCIGGFFADGDTEFNVAIRTLDLRPDSGIATYGTGCGVVWDSDPLAEYRESLLKTALLSHEEPEMQLIETMRVEQGRILHPEQHLARITQAAAELGVELDAASLQSQLTSDVSDDGSPQKARLTCTVSGETDLTISPLPATPEPMTFRVDTEPTSSTHPELRYKTTRRNIYAQARNRHPDVQETLLMNERGECMEFCIGNLVIEINGERWTPSPESGFLSGTARARLLEAGVQEKVLRIEDLEAADAIYLTNAVRGEVRMEWIKAEGATPSGSVV